MQNFRRIIEILEKECELYTILLDLSYKKTQMIVDGKVKELEKIVEAEQRLIIQLGHFEDEREESIGRYAEEQGIEIKDITISYLISQAQDDLKVRLQKIQETLHQVVENQKEVNQLNERLIKNNLEFIDFSLGLITGRDQSGNIYEKTGGAVIKQQERGLIDKKV
jgi:Mg2+ and Co2+ transporter CorA